MRRPPHVLLNTPEIEIWPADLLRARSNRDARILSRATRVLRRKRDGRYLAADLPEGLMPLLPRWSHAPGIDAALDALDLQRGRTRGAPDHSGELPLHRIAERLQRLGLDAEAYASRSGLALVAEPEQLAFAGFDRYRRALWLQADAAAAWRRMRDAALREDIALDAISGYRSHDYQLAIFERKQARGLSVEDILAVNAAPGFSEHHDGRALDLGTPGEAAAEESFERTPAFGWLTSNAAAYGFRMSYPRDNPHGIVYEPWHWYHASR